MNINKKSRKSLVGPASCMALLVLLAVATMCPVSSRARVNATDGSGSSSADTADTEDTLPTEENGEENDAPSDEAAGDEVTPVSDENTNASARAAASAALSITSGGALDQTTSAEHGKLATRAHNVHITASDIEAYSLQITAASGASPNLTLDNTSTTIGGVGTGGTVGTSIGDNKWGWAWSDTASANPNSMTYYTLPAYNTSGTNMATGKIKNATVSSGSVNLTGTLAFAAKFGSSAASGHYRTSVLLALTATPKKVANIGGISTMQEMTAEICRNSDIGAAKNLRDTRDGSEYSIRKHEDGNCWMTQNLRIVNKTITPADSDVTTNYTIPASSLSGFSSSNYYANQVYYANNATNGAYYSWTAATAGTGTSSVTSGDAPSSVCPKGWKLPPNSGNGSYTNFTSAAGITNSADGSNKIRSAPYNFPYAGLVNYGSLSSVGSNGYYWSRTAYSSNSAYHLYFDSAYVYPAYSSTRYHGFSVRCVAVSS